MRKPGNRLLSAYSLGLSALFLAPIVVVVVVSFSGDSYLRFPPSSFALQWYSKVFGNPGWRNALWLSTYVALASGLVSTAVAGAAAYALVRGTMPGRNAFLLALLLPMILPGIVTAVGMYLVSLRLGLVGNTLWLALCHSVICMPPVLLILLTTLAGIDVSLERAAFGLGCGRLEVLRRVTIPIAMPGLLSAFFVAFLGSFDEFIVSFFLLGTRGQTLPVMIYQSIFLQIEPTIAAVSTLVIAVTALLIAADRLFRMARVAAGPARMVG